jgi:hypothetical protein
MTTSQGHYPSSACSGERVAGAATQQHNNNNNNAVMAAHILLLEARRETFWFHVCQGQIARNFRMLLIGYVRLRTPAPRAHTFSTYGTSRLEDTQIKDKQPPLKRSDDVISSAEFYYSYSNTTEHDTWKRVCIKQRRVKPDDAVFSGNLGVLSMASLNYQDLNNG